MMKHPYLRSASLAVVVALTGCEQSDGSAGEDQPAGDDLGAIFDEFATAKVDAAATRSLVRSDGRATIRSSSWSFDLELQENDVRSASYRAVDHVSGEERELDAQPLTTYKGRLRDDPGSFVRLTLTDANVEGYIVDGSGEKFFIEPAGRFASSAATDEFVIYRADSIIPKSLGQCSSSGLADRIAAAEDLVHAQSGSAAPLRVLTMATDADHHYVQAAGGAVQANTEILGILNMVDGIYEQELGISVEVAWQHTWTTPAPFSGLARDGYLDGFRSHWNAANAAPRDVTHIWTAQPGLQNSGYAYESRNGAGVICRHPDYAYGFVGEVKFENSRFVSEIYRIAAHELAHNFSAPHVEGGACANTMMNAQISIDFNEVETFCQASRDTITSYVTGNGNCLDVTQPPMGKRWPRADFDGDGKDEPTVFRPSDGTWYMARPDGTLTATQFGQSGDRLVAADYDGDKRTDHAVFRAGTWYILQSSNNAFQSIPFGLANDIPTPADFDGDGKTDVAVYRPSDGTWYIMQSAQGGALRTAVFGVSEDIPLPGDYDGDGKADINVWRPSNTVWYRLNSIDNSFYALQWGSPGDKPSHGDFDGDLKQDIAVYRPSAGTWYVRRSTDELMWAVPWGVAEDVPVVADYDKDGKDDLAIFRPSTTTWAVLRSGDNGNTFLQFGAPGDIPSQTAQH